MKKSIISLAVAAGLVASMPAAHAGDVKVKWFGFAQITAKQGDGLDPGPGDNKATDPTFGADRVRFGFKIKDGNVFGGLQADLNRNHAKAKAGTLNETIKDVYAGYKFSNAASIKAGQFKTPVGMDFNTSGKKLDITQRGMEKGLVLERAAGIMLSGRKIANGFGYDLFYGNPAGRGAASPLDPAAKTEFVIDQNTGTLVSKDISGPGGKTGNTNSYAARVMYDMGKMMHVELGYGVDETVVTGTGFDDYEVLDFAMKMKMGKAHTIKFEYIDGSNVKGNSLVDESVWYAHYGYLVNKSVELVARHYQADIDVSADPAVPGSTGGSRTLTNTYLGANFFLGSNKTNGRVQLYYVVAGGDNNTDGTGNSYLDASDESAAGGSAYYDDVILAQYQVSF